MIIELTIILSTATATVEASNDIDVTIVLNDEVVNPEGSFCERVDACLGISQSGDANKFLNERGNFVTITGGGAVDSVNGQTGTVVLDTDDINEGSTNKYFTESRVRSTVLTGLSLATNAVISATDSVLVAFGKLQAQITAISSSLSGYVTLATEQTISALKTFTNGITITPQATPTYARGRVYFDDTNDCLAFMDNISTTSVQVGYEVLMRARNNTGSQINNGQVVYINGSIGTNSTVALAQANAEATSLIIGVATHNIANNSTGKIVVFGLANDLDTSAFTDGQEVFLSATVAGGLTSTPPASPNFVVRIGIVERAHPTQGKILVKPEITTANNNSLGTSQRVAPTQNSVKTYVDTQDATKADKSNTTLTTYLEIPEQSKPATPTNATRLFIDSSNRLSWIGENGYVRTFDGTANTADRIYTLPNASGTIALTSDLSSYVPTSRTITINGVTYDLSANRSWTVSSDLLTALRTQGFYFDDFDIVGTISSASFIHNTFYVSYGGSWQATSWATTGLNMWGVVQVNTLNSTASMGFGSNSFQYQTILGGATFETRVRFEDLSTATDRFTYYGGFLNNATFNGNNRIRFNYSDNINSGKFQIECNAGGVGTTADSGVTVVADTWYVLKFVINSAANSVEFFINGVSVGTIATNIPSNGVYPFTQINRSAYVNTRQIYVDYHFAQTTLNR